ncbi:MAG: DEAD/DEAH box helicase [Muribaculaceae bacterium]|nr:DEAD/DEAH box helicase [Muribaculaceae bacterium]
MNEKEILDRIATRLGIATLNPMQQSVVAAAHSHRNLVVYSPTGSGKTLAFAIPLLRSLNASVNTVQAVVIAPSRELVLQTAQVLRQVAVGFKVTACYGGHPVVDERQSLNVPPAVLVATPGRLLDHINRRHIDVSQVRFLVLDEFDKSLELGFEDDMKSVLGHMTGLSQRILTSATVMRPLPPYVCMAGSVEINFLGQMEQPSQRTSLWHVCATGGDKNPTLLRLLLSLNTGRSIVFVNFRDAVEPVQRFLTHHHVVAGAYHGALAQQEREMALAMFRNGSLPVLVTTDLGSRGLDIDHVSHVIHYHMPLTAEVYTHRNGRTARVDEVGEVFVITAPDEQLPDFITPDAVYELPSTLPREAIEPQMATIYFKAGKKEKLSRGDVVGFITAHSHVPASEIGLIDVSDHHTLVAVPRHHASALVEVLRPHKIKGRRVLISEVKI